jgi:hypothetical protein
MSKSMMAVTLSGCVLSLALAGCDGGNDVDVTGDYSLRLTDAENGCQINPDKWSAGNTSDVKLNITRSEGNRLYGEVVGITALFVGLATGTTTFTGSADGSSVNLQIAGNVSAAAGTCDYKLDLSLHGEVSGDFIAGTLTYSFATDHAADCGFRETCKSVQKFNGTRPPK